MLKDAAGMKGLLILDGLITGGGMVDLVPAGQGEGVVIGVPGADRGGAAGWPPILESGSTVLFSVLTPDNCC